MSLKTVKEELTNLSNTFADVATKCNTVANEITIVATTNIQDVITPATQLQLLIANNARYIEKANSDFRGELEIILADYSNEISKYIAESYSLVQLLGVVISLAKEIYDYNYIAIGMGLDCPYTADELRPYSREIQEFSTLCRGLAEESRKWSYDLVEGSR